MADLSLESILARAGTLGGPPVAIPANANPAATESRAATRSADQKLTVLRADATSPPDAALLARLQELASLPWVEAILALPDLHQKPNAEVPSSVAITTQNAIVPQFTSVAINDGMGVVVTGLEERDLTPERIERFLTRVNTHAAAHALDGNRYSLSAADEMQAALEGGIAGIDRYGLGRDTLAGMESGGRVPVPGGRETWEETVPSLLRRSALGRSEMGLNFGGNH